MEAKIRLFFLFSVVFLTNKFHLSAQTYTPNRQEFLGPFPSWVNIKTKYGAKGDGISDDTRALQQAFNEIGKGGEDDVQVLYLPAGTYRITAGLTMSAKNNVSLIGEAPSSTIIKWDGASGGTMFSLNGVTYSRFSRITWNGSGKAHTAIAHKWDGSTGWAVTHNEHSDEAFVDVGHGLRGGKPHTMDAETAILRCRFIRNSIAGVSIESFNALDWYIWDSYFEDCRIGVTNDPPTGGAGNFHVFQSIFKRSTYADISIRNTMYFSVRNNYSIGSKAFFVSEPMGNNGGPITLQKNIVLDAQDVSPLRFGSKGPITLLDNTIRSKDGQAGPVVTAEGDITTVGNIFTVNNTIAGKEKWITVDDAVQSRNAVNPGEPTLLGTPVKRTRRVFEVPSSGSADDKFQKIVDSAAALAGQRPVIHLRAGGYGLSKTVVIPAGSDMQIIGDGFHSRLMWFGGAGGEVLRLEGADNLVLEGFSINGGEQATGITVKHSDQSGRQIFMEGVSVSNCREVGVTMQGFSTANAELHDFNHSGNYTGVKVAGGGSSTNGRLTIFGGASSDNSFSYDVTNGGNLMAQDIWYEGSPKSFVTLTGSGNFTLNGAKIYASSAPDVPVIVNNFNGKATFLGVNMNGKFSVQGDGANTNVLALGMQFDTQNAYTNSSPRAKAAMLNSRVYTQGSFPLNNSANPDLAFIRTMLDQVRNQRPEYKAVTGGLIMHRVQATRSLTGIRIQPSSAVTNQLPAIAVTAPTSNASFTAPATVNITATASDNDGTVSKVEFFNGSTKLGEKTAAPYSFSWNNVGEGSYTVTAKATDNSGTTVVSSTATITVNASTTPPSGGACAATGTILWETWANVPGSSVGDIPVSAAPTGTSRLTVFEAPSNAGEGYGSRIRGYVCVPTTGSYTFWIAGDDNCELWLSTDETPGNKTRIAYVDSYTGVREWTKSGTQQSAPVTLTAGRKYYIEALHKEAFGGDNLAVGWQLPDGTLERPIAGSRLAPFTPTTPAPAPAACSGTGSIIREYWSNIRGSSVGDIPVSAAPTGTSRLTVFEAPSNAGEGYGSRIRGYVCVPTTGSYTFWIAGDDNCELWLSTDETPGNKTRIAYVDSYTGVREWTKSGTQQSAPVTLTAGRKYYIEALHKEAFGGDNLAVGWQLPDGTLERPIAGSRLAPYEEATQNFLTQASAAYTNAYASSVYPNPASTTATLTFTAQQAGTAYITVTNSLALPVKRVRTTTQVGTNSVVISIENLQTGYYFININNQFVEKLVIAK